jgi:type VI secretion system protein ImpA
MGSPSYLNLEELLSPIPGDSPTGTDLRLDRGATSVYDKIKDARSAAREFERKQEQGAEPEGGGLLPSWRIVLDLAPNVIATQSKDLEIGALLIEALLRSHGVGGLRDGFRLARQLVESFWDRLYPSPDEDGISARVAPLAGLNGEGADGTLIQPIRKVPITEYGDSGQFTLAQYEQASELLRLGDETKVQQRIAAGSVTLETIENSARQSAPEFFIGLLDDLAACLEEFDKLCAALEAACGRDAPPSSRIRGLLTTMVDAVRHIARDVIPTSAPVIASATAADGPAVSVIGAVQAATALTSREEAFRTLLKVAEYFRQTEPQSLVSYVIEEAVRRAKLPLPQLLDELIPDAAARRLFLIAAGVQPPGEPP